MQPTYEELLKEIEILKRAAKIHIKYSISQYQKVLKSLELLEKQKAELEEKVKKRTLHLEEEIRKKEQLTKELEKIAKYDFLTSLANRYYFNIYLKRLYLKNKISKEPFSLIFIDLDGFKNINDYYGHDYGDVVLKEVAKRIKEGLRKCDFVARLGGDEFVAVLDSIEDRELLNRISNNLLKNITQPIEHQNIRIDIGASIGVYSYSFEEPFEEILINADLAMYQAKNSGKNRVVFFERNFKNSYHQHLTLKERLKKAFKNKEFVNFLQPIVSCDNKKIAGAEVLIRWYEDGSFVSPGEFILTLEEMDIIKDVTRWQIQNCTECLQKNKEIFMTFNIAAKCLEDDMLLEVIDEIEKKVDIRRIHFELTESDFVKDVKRAKYVLGILSKKGVKIVLDDFGTGYSSLAYIRDFPVSKIKIDKDFVKHIVTSQKDKRLFKAMLSFMHALGSEVIVEGVETKEQLDLIPKRDDIFVQGYFFYKPMPKSEFRQLLRNKL